jgi:4-amino-4-deoxy-L-arabinose transferase-like glycosyltransferase
LNPTAIVAYIALADFAFHLLIAYNYGYFRDELYYIVAGEHLAFGYVDFPPIIAVFAAILGLVANDSLISIHFVSALAGAAIVFMSGVICRELGGGVRAQVLAALATVFSASFAVASIFSMDVLDMLWWTILAYILVKIIRSDNKQPKFWIALGIVAGVGLMTKLTIVFFLFALIVGVVLSSRFVVKKKSLLKSRWFWLAALIAFAFLLPYILWNAANGFPTVDFYIHHGGLNGGGPVSFLVYQVLIANPIGLPLAILGVIFLFRSKLGRPYSSLGISYITLLVIFTLMNAKPYFIMGAYPFLFAAGAVLVEGATKHKPRLFAYAGYLLAILVVGSALAPLYAPILPPQVFVTSYGALTGVGNGAAAQQTSGQFPQYLGDRFGWNTMVATVAQVYHSLPPSEQAEACILTLNYGEASALIVLGKSYNLPRVISGHNNFYIWGPQGCSGSVLIAVGYSFTDIKAHYGNVTVGGTITCTYCMSDEDGLPVLVATDPVGSLQGEWSSIKHFD